MGHAEGITYVTSKGDNRYLASNGKDQKMLLWDLRMMHSSRDYSKLPKTRDSGFDYRSDHYRGHKASKIPVCSHVQQQLQVLVAKFMLLCLTRLIPCYRATAR